MKGRFHRLRRAFRWVRVPEAAKRVLTPLLGPVRMTIRGGANAGLRWSLASYGSGYGSGRRAHGQMHAISGLIRSGDVVWDVGAHHGYVTICAARRVGTGGRVHAFEPSEGSRWFLERHVRWNAFDNVTVHGVALSSFSGQSRLGGGTTSKQRALGPVGPWVTVDTTSSVIGTGAAGSPSFVKVDVEGAEADVLENALPVLRPDTRMLVAVHSPVLRVRVLDLLRSAGYTTIESRQMQGFVEQGRWRGDADVFCHGPAHEEGAEDRAILDRCGV